MAKFARQTCAALVLSLSLASAPACALRAPANATPQQVEQIRLHQLQRVARVTEEIGKLVVSLQAVEIALYQQGRVPPETHRFIQTYLEMSSTFVLAGLETAKDATKTADQRRDGLLQALQLVAGFQTQIVEKIGDESVKARLSAITLAIQTLLLTVQLVT